MPSPAEVASRRPASTPPFGAPGYGTPAPPASSYGTPTPPAGSGYGPPPAAQPPAVASAPSQPCPYCGAQTPAGFAFCQQCGKKLGAAAQTGPASARHAQVVSGEMGGPLIDVVAPTMATTTADPVALKLRERSMAQPIAPTQPNAPPQASTAARPAWGSLVSINQDGSEGARHGLHGDWAHVGRSDAEISFPDDRLLALRHARIERSPSAPRVVPLDTLNGVYRRIGEPTPLVSGAIFLAGREVFRFELVDEDERIAAPLVRHGVALFGSPPREPWGRIYQLLASGGVRDVRHLAGPAAIIGREEGDIVLRDDAFLSRRHASLSWRDGRCLLEDLDSSNGTFVRLTGPHPVRSGDQLRMGDQLFRVELSR